MAAEGAVPKKGSLKEWPFHKLLLHSYTTYSSEVFVFTRGDVKKLVRMEKGAAVACRSNKVEETMLAWYTNNGIFNKDRAYEAAIALKEAKESNPNAMLGQVLLGKAMISTQQLEEGLRGVLLERLLDLFTWDDGEYVIHPPQAFMGEVIKLDDTPAKLIYRGLRFAAQKRPELISIDQAAVPLQTQHERIVIDELGLSGDELTLLRTMQGKSDLEKLLSEATLKSEDANAFIYSMHAMGLLELKKAEAKSGLKDRLSKKGTEKAKPKSATSPEKKVERKLKAVQDKTHFDVLGVDEKASVADVKKAYFKLAKDFHPDRLPATVSKEVKEMGEKLFTMISEAFHVLSDPGKREEYMQILSGDQQTQEDATEQAVKILESEAVFQMASGQMRNGDFNGALKSLDKAIELYSEEPEYHIHRGWAMFRVGLAKKDEKMQLAGRKEIEKNLDKRPKLDQGYLFLGQIFKQQEDTDRARKFFQKALSVNANCHEAEREIRLMEMRAEKAGKKSGLFKRR